MKTKPTSIRFNEEKLKFFQEKNPKLDTPQKIVDNFLDMFWWRHHQEPEKTFQQPLLPEDCEEGQDKSDTADKKSVPASKHQKKAYKGRKGTQNESDVNVNDLNEAAKGNRTIDTMPEGLGWKEMLAWREEHLKNKKP